MTMAQDQELDGRTAIVTGAGAGIGAGIAEQLAAAGATVIVNDIDPAAADETARRLRDAGGAGHAVVADIGSPDGPSAVVTSALEQTGRLDVLVNNAGVAPGIVPLLEVDDEAMERTWRINLRGMMQCTRAAIEPMRRQGTGRIVNISSRTWLGTPGHTAYAASKGGVVSFTRTLALELGPFGITANVIAPGSVLTPSLERLGPEYLQTIFRRHPAGRLGDPSDIGRAVRFFAHPRSGMITGQVLHVCGGRSLHGGPWDERAGDLAAADTDREQH